MGLLSETIGRKSTGESNSSREYRNLIFEILFEFSYMAGGERSGTHYLPAARSGIMQSHRVIASSLVTRSTRGGLERFPELPTFSGVMADFLQQLILYEGGAKAGRYDEKPG